MRTSAPTPSRPAQRGALRLIISGIIAGIVFSPVADIVGGFAGLWQTPAHSVAVLDQTATSLAQPLSRLPISAIVFDPLPHPTKPLLDLLIQQVAVAGNCLQTSLLRLYSVTLYLPAIVLIVTVTVADALLKRNFRRLRVEREHGYIFHRLQRLRGAALFWPVFLVLAIPTYLPPIAVTAAVIPAIAYLWLNMTLFKRNV